jgi:multiple sugar transport system permease protein
MITVPAAETLEPTEARPLHVVTGRRTRVRPARVMMHVFLISVALLWLVPIGTALYNSFRFYESDTQVNGVFAPP